MISRGNPNASVMIIGDGLSNYEARSRAPFLGDTGRILDHTLQEVGILTSDCYFTTVMKEELTYLGMDEWMTSEKKHLTPLHIPMGDKWIAPTVYRALGELEKEIELVNPKVILVLGDLPLFLLTHASPVDKWRGSQIELRGRVIFPSYHPRMILRQEELRPLFTRDLRRVAQHIKVPVSFPQWNVKIRPTMDEVLSTLSLLHSMEEVWIDLDIETRANHIACLGLSWNSTDALVIPFMTVGKDHYWLEDEEGIIVHTLYKLLTRKGVKVRWQNGLFDAQFIHKYWHFIPNHGQDTMISHHTLFPGLRKSLAFQASLYCKHYLFWKDDGRLWTKDMGEEQLWRYNAQDCLRTREIGESLTTSLAESNLTEVDAYQQALFSPTLYAMIKGVKVDMERKTNLSLELTEEMGKREELFITLLGHSLNPRSSTQMTQLFYGDLQQKKNKTRAKKGTPGHLTMDDEALATIMKREPVLTPLIKAIQEYRSLGVFLNTFVMAQVDEDKRMRSSFNICGAETFRFSSSKNPFGVGMNFQNIPKGGEDALILPNIRKLFIPDVGYTFFDMDLDRADLQVVVWESGEEELKAALRTGVDMHMLNAMTLKGKSSIPLDEICEGHPKYDEWRSIYKKERQLAKTFIHGTNYSGSPRTMAIHAGITTIEAERFQNTYFGRYPGIKRWHHRVEESLKRTHTVTNAFGYRRTYFEDTSRILPKALAWVPQSTVANVINRAWINLYNNTPYIQVLIQVHDSLAGQFPTHLKDKALKDLKENARIVVPYKDPLIIPVGVKVSLKSWGDCE